jgi:hypothetical protein
MEAMGPASADGGCYDARRLVLLGNADCAAHRQRWFLPWCWVVLPMVSSGAFNGVGAMVPPATVVAETGAARRASDATTGDG